MCEIFPRRSVQSEFLFIYFFTLTTHIDLSRDAHLLKRQNLPAGSECLRINNVIKYTLLEFFNSFIAIITDKTHTISIPQNKIN